MDQEDTRKVNTELEELKNKKTEMNKSIIEMKKHTRRNQ